MQSHTSIQFGQGYYQLTHLVSETGKPVLRGPLTEKRQRVLLSNPKGSPDYMAQAILRDTSFQLDEHLLKREKMLANQTIPNENYQLITFEMYNNSQYAVIDLDAFNVQIAASKESPEEFFWMNLVNEKNETIAQIRFHNMRMNIFSNESLIVRGQENTLHTLSISTFSDVLINDFLAVETALHVTCRSLMLKTGAPLKSQFIKILSFKQCVIAAETDILTQNCQIRSGKIQHHGYIEAEKSVSFISETSEITGKMIAKGINGISIVSLGLQADKTSHLHGSIVNLLVGSPVKKNSDMPDFMGKINLFGKLSTKGLTIITNDLTFDHGKTMVQGRITLATIYKTKITKSAEVLFNGKSLYQYSQFASFIEGTITESPGLEIYSNIIILPGLTLSEYEKRRSHISEQLVHKKSQKPKALREIEFLPALTEQKNYSHKPYDKSKFSQMETELPPENDKAPNQIIFSGLEFLSLKADITVSSPSNVHLQALYTQFFGHIEDTSFFESINVSVLSDELEVRNAVIRTDQGRVALESKNIQISDSTLIAGQMNVHAAESLSFPAPSTLSASGKIHIESKKNSTIPKGSALTLKSPLPVTWECENFYLRGRLEFQQLSIHAEKTILMIGADVKGDNFHANARDFIAFLSRFTIKKTFSVQSVISITAFCVILSELYTNSSIINLSSSIYLPSSLTLSGKSLLSCFLAASNTLISILQLVIHEPTSQLALAAVRLGINAGPALLQLYQLVKNINEAKKSPHLERGKLIQIVNQTKSLCLTLGSLAYGAAGLADQFAHASFFPDSFSHSWDNASSIISNLTNVTTPLMNLAFPGVQKSDFFDMNLDLICGFSDSTSTIVNVNGTLNVTLTSSTLTVADGVLPTAVDASPVLSTKTSLVSVSTAAESILPTISHSERTMYKTFVGTGMPTIAEQTSLTANEMVFINHADREFRDSTLHTNQLSLSKDSHLSVTNSSLTVTDQVENEGFVQYAGAAVQIDHVHNHKDAVTIAVSSDLKESHVQDDAGSAKQIIATKYESQDLTESGLLAGDVFSRVNIEKAHFTQESKAGFRTTRVDMTELKDETKDGIYLDFQGTHHVKDRQAPSPLKQHTKKNPEHESSELHYEDDSHLSATLTPFGTIQYHAEGSFDVEKSHLVSFAGLGVDASDTLRVNRSVSSTSSLFLRGDQATQFNHSNLSVNGSLDIQGGNVLVNGGSIESGDAIKINGKKTTIQDSSKILAVNDIELSSDTQFVSEGKKTVTTHIERHKEWLGLGEKTEKTTTFNLENNIVASRDGEVTVTSGEEMKLKGTTIQAESDITLQSGKDMTLDPLLGTDSVKKDHTILFGEHITEKKSDNVSSCQLMTKKTITLSPGGNIYNLGTEFSAEETKIEVSGHHKIVNSRVVLNRHYTEKREGLYYGGMSFPSSIDQYVSNLPLVHNTKKFMRAKSADARESATVHLAAETMNTANTLMSSYRHHGIVSTLEKTFLPDLSVTFKLGHSQLDVDDLREGPGSINTKRLVITAEEADFLENYGVNAESTKFNIGKLQVTGAKLHHDVNFQENDLTYSISPSTLLHPDLGEIGLEHRDSHTNQTVWVGDGMNLGDLTLRGQEANFYGAGMKTKSMQGHEDKMTFDAEKNSSSHSSHQISLSSFDHFSIDINEKFSEQAAITNPLKSEDMEMFSVGTLTSHGAKLDKVKADNYQFSPIDKVNQKVHWGVSGSVHDLLPNHHSSRVFSSWDIRWKNTGFSVPVYHPLGGKIFSNNLSFLMRHAPNPTPFESVPVKKVERKNSPQPAATPAKKLSSEKPDYFDAALLYQQSQSLQIDWNTNETKVNSTVLQKMENMLEQTVTPALGGQENYPDNYLDPNILSNEKNIVFPQTDFVALYNQFEQIYPEFLFNIFSGNNDSDEISYHFFNPWDILATPVKAGLFVEMVEHDLYLFKSRSESFQTLIKTSEVETYLSTAEKLMGKSTAFSHFVENVLDPFSIVFGQGSYFHSLFSYMDNTKYVSYDVFTQPDLKSMVGKVAENIDNAVNSYEKLLHPLRTFYIFSTISDAVWQWRDSYGRQQLCVTKSVMNLENRFCPYMMRKC
ncbi:MAG TPA: hypothetical protein VLI69_05535 [Gammaproteobacteria bacterium]|nr:hypothetical protein [Gammaproteobacteria bacterium]